MKNHTTSTVATNTAPAREKRVFVGCFSILVLLVIICIGFGVHLLRPSWNTIQNAQRSPDWPQTSAQVTGARVIFNDAGQASEGRSTWVPEVTYTYQVNGTAYEGDTIRFSRLVFLKRGAKDRAQDVIDPYAGFPKVTVSHDPDDPSISVLEPGVTMGTFSAITDSVGYILIGLVGVAFLSWIFFPRRADKVKLQSPPQRESETE